MYLGLMGFWQPPSPERRCPTKIHIVDIVTKALGQCGAAGIVRWEYPCVVVVLEKVTRKIHFIG